MPLYENVFIARQDISGAQVDTLADTFTQLIADHGGEVKKRENWGLLWWLMLQRFGYRQLMYYVVVRSISTALRGVFVSWGKLERAGTVQPRRSAQRGT